METAEREKPRARERDSDNLDNAELAHNSNSPLSNKWKRQTNDPPGGDNADDGGG
jgi:hypothetical protein